MWEFSNEINLSTFSGLIAARNLSSLRTDIYFTI